jgi:hypothetical protein
MCTLVITEPDNKELECRRIIMQSIDNALKRGDEVFEKLTRKTVDNDSIGNYKRFKDELKNINHENLKK